MRRRVVRLGDRLCDLSVRQLLRGATEVLPCRSCGRHSMTTGSWDFSTRRSAATRSPGAASRTPCGRAMSYRLRSPDVVLTPGAMAALQMSLRAVGSPGDEVIVPVPCWLDYPLYVRSLGLRAILVPHREPTFRLDLAAIQRAVTERTCAILMSTPNNPTGTTESDDTIRDLSATHRQGRDRCRQADHADRRRDPSRLQPAGLLLVLLERGRQNADRILFRETTFMQGQRLGYVAVSPTHPRGGDRPGTRPLDAHHRRGHADRRYATSRARVAFSYRGDRYDHESEVPAPAASS